MDKMRFAVLGFGNRGRLYTDILLKSGRGVLTAVCDTDPEAVGCARSRYGVAAEYCYGSADEFFARGKIADALIIATMDRAHYGQTLAALKIGYDILLEKPVALSVAECEEIADAAEMAGRRVTVCHVLRYTPFYQKLKELIAGGAIGEVMSMEQSENVGYWHYAHSFVRGNWRNSTLASPIILQKCCHDLDIISWLTDSTPKSVSSFGALTHFRKENAPSAAAYCFECEKRPECVYDCFKFYKEKPDWLSSRGAEMGGDEIETVLKDRTVPFSRCVYRCDNDVADHQTVSIFYENGITVTLAMNAFTPDISRDTVVHGTRGELRGRMEDNKIFVNLFGEPQDVIDLTEGAESDFSGHSGGDSLLIEDFYESVRGGGKAKGLTDIRKSVLSHRLALLAERSRQSGGAAIEVFGEAEE